MIPTSTAYASSASPYAPPLTPARPNAPAAGAAGGVPRWLRQRNPGRSEADLARMYSDYLRRNPTAPGNRPTSPVPSATNPAAPPPLGGPPSGPPFAPGSLPPAGGPPSPPTVGPRAPGLRDIYDVYLSSVPVMNEERDRQISGAMASAGFSGNRYGTAAMRTAGQIGAETSLRQNQLLNSLLYNQNEADANRALQASDQGLRLAGLEDQLQRGRLDQLFGFGSWEQGRMDNFARLGYQDFENNKYGLLSLLIQFAASQSGGSAATPYAVQQPGSTGAADWLTLLAGLF